MSKEAIKKSIRSKDNYIVTDVQILGNFIRFTSVDYYAEKKYFSNIIAECRMKNVDLKPLSTCPEFHKRFSCSEDNHI